MLSTALISPGPHPDSDLALFGRFVGSWAVDGWYTPRGGDRFEFDAEWHFGWVLEGRAIQDVLIRPRAGSSAAVPPEYGTTLRIPDARVDGWRIAWLSAFEGSFSNLIAKPVGDRIVLEGTLYDGWPTRWSFNDITERSFLWRGEIGDGNGGWTLNEEMACGKV